MARAPLRSLDDAPADAKELLAAAEARNGFLPNLLRVHANAPVALETYLTVCGINARSSLSLAEREAVQITAAAEHGCGFCVAGHTAIITKAGLDPAVIASRGRVEDADLAAFRAAGFDAQAAPEVVLGVSLATLCNFANNLGDASLNQQLEPFRWDAPRASAA
ncbi:carboxymuconolactone decarboxylase family protein [Xanthobacter autotrophicus]|uniref:carboxymuconolactone decarboxylase family protein n=1 Tax=Xanthobacter autotrophicus TaxID=280 RepID=UPI003726B104